jgi:hypothetical protein
MSLCSSFYISVPQNIYALSFPKLLEKFVKKSLELKLYD